MGSKIPGRPEIVKIAAIEVLITFMLAVMMMVFDITAVYSAVMGGLIAVLANLVCLLASNKYFPASAVHKMVRAFYQGEIYKLVTVAVLFAVIFKFVKPINVISLFSAFIIVIIINGFLPMIMAKESKKID